MEKCLSKLRQSPCLRQIELIEIFKLNYIYLKQRFPTTWKRRKVQETKLSCWITHLHQWDRVSSRTRKQKITNRAKCEMHYCTVPILGLIGLIRIVLQGVRGVWIIIFMCRPFKLKGGIWEAHPSNSTRVLIVNSKVSYWVKLALRIKSSMMAGKSVSISFSTCDIPRLYHRKLLYQITALC